MRSLITQFVNCEHAFLLVRSLFFIHGCGFGRGCLFALFPVLYLILASFVFFLFFKYHFSLQRPEGTFNIIDMGRTRWYDV
jgi:hypothetical protein